MIDRNAGFPMKARIVDGNVEPSPALSSMTRSTLTKITLKWRIRSVKFKRKNKPLLTLRSTSLGL